MSKSVIELCARSLSKFHHPNSDWDETELVSAVLTTLATNLDVRALDEAIAAYLKSQWRAMNEATGENPVAVAIQTYFNAIKEGEHE